MSMKQLHTHQFYHISAEVNSLLHFIISFFTDMLYSSQKISGKISITASKEMQLLKIHLQKALLALVNPVGYKVTDVVFLHLQPS